MAESVTPARLRVAPSPTGDPHVGTAYMSLFNLAYARRSGGQFILRIEDTDQNRFQADSEEQIFSTLRWLGLEWDEGPDIGGPVGPYRQSERLATYRRYADQLIDQGQAYYCWCSAERLQQLRQQQAADKVAETGYDRCCYGLTVEQRSVLPGFSDQPVVRMLIPADVELGFVDLIRGPVKTPRPDDQVILKADGFPTYHLAVVVDDHLMGITHVVRGEEWISSTPKHRLLYRWLGWPEPVFAHMPLLRNSDKSKISKRRNPAARLLWFRQQGYLPEALLNFMQLLAYPPVDPDSEIQTWQQFWTDFDWSKVNTTGPIFDLTKLDWLNGSYIRALPAAELADRIEKHLRETGQWTEVQPAVVAKLRLAAPIIQPRLTRLDEALAMIDFLLVDDDELTIDPAALARLDQSAPTVLAAADQVLAAVTDADVLTVEAALRQSLVTELGLKPRLAFAPLRVAISGRQVSPPLFESMAILGWAACRRRLARLMEALAAGSNQD